MVGQMRPGCKAVTDITVFEHLGNLGMVQLGGTGVAPTVAAALKEKQR